MAAEKERVLERSFPLLDGVEDKSGNGPAGGPARSPGGRHAWKRLLGPDFVKLVVSILPPGSI